MRRKAIHSELSKLIDETGASRRRGPLALIHAIGKNADKEDSRTSRVSDWMRLKAVIIAERGPACEACPAVMPSAGMVHLHHVLPKSQGGTDHRENAALLCPNCHGKAHWLYRTLKRFAQTRDELFDMLKAA